MLIPVKNTDLEQELLIFAIEGEEYNLYSSYSDLESIKNAFIKCTGDNSEYKDYKYIALTKSSDISTITTLAVTYNNKFIIEEHELNDKDTYPIKARDLENMLIELGRYYKKFGFEIIFR